MSLEPCWECGREISEQAMECPHCGCPTEHSRRERKKQLDRQGCWFIVGMFVVGYLLLMLL